MILPVFIIIADIAAWALFADSLAMQDPMVGLITFGFALGFFVWLIIEVMELVSASNTDRIARDPD